MNVQTSNYSTTTHIHNSWSALTVDVIVKGPRQVLGWFLLATELESELKLEVQESTQILHIK